MERKSNTKLWIGGVAELETHLKDTEVQYAIVRVVPEEGSHKTRGLF